MKRKILLTILLVALLTNYAFAIDINYTGPVDSYTDQPLTGGGNINEKPTNTKGLVQLKGSKNATEYYDYDNRMFVYRLGSGAEIVSSVADGMVTTNTVNIVLPEVLGANLYRDGQILSEAVGSITISTPGSYVIDVRDGNNFIQPLKFTIVNSITGMLDEYVMPNNFNITEAKKNNSTFKATKQRVDLSEEGSYEITYICTVTKEQYKLDIDVDHTPPTLALEGVVDGVAKGPVSLDDVEPHASIYIEHNNKPIGTKFNLTESGAYTVTVKDQAGNKTEYKFVIQIYLNTSSVLFIILFLALLIGILVYVLKSKNSLRVR